MHREVSELLKGGYKMVCTGKKCKCASSHPAWWMKYQVFDMKCGVRLKSVTYCEFLHSERKNELVAQTLS